MSQAPRQSRGFHPIRAAASVFRVRDLALDQIDPDGLKYVATVSVRAHWFIVALMLFELVYRPYYGVAKYAAYGLLLGMLIGLNGYIHHRLHANRPVTWRWVSALFALDVFLLSAVLTISDGFSHYFFHLFYYGALAGSAVIFTSFRLNMAWATVVAVVYAAISLTVGDGIDMEAREEKVLLARIAVMYVVVVAVNLATRFERIRWRQAAERERALQRERVEFSQAVHDTAAQSAYMIGLGIDAAKQVAGDSNEELTARLEATSLLSKTAIWQLRHPIDMGRIFDGRELGWTLDSHIATFTSVTSVSAELTQNGVEPPLSIEAKSLLFTIAHNALTNAFRHAEASRVLIELDFGRDELRLSVSDDGVGLPDDYEERGQGFENMRTDAERLGGRLIVESRGPAGGASVACVMPLGRAEREG